MSNNQIKTTTLKPCVICKAESCFVIPGIASSQCFCLLHYYTTGVHNDGISSTEQTSNNKKKQAAGSSKKNKKTSLLVDNDRMNRQLPKVQEIFAEAFVELRAEIGEESARAFQKSNNADDPLAGLLADGDGTSSFKSMPSQSMKKFPRTSNKRKPTDSQRAGGNDDGGFIREAILPEKLRKLQHPNVNLEHYSPNSKRDNNVNTSLPMYNRKQIDTTVVNNPYRKRKKTSSIWHQILDSDATKDKSDDGSKKPKAKRNWDDMEKEMIRNITSSNATGTIPSKSCSSCNSTNIEIIGNSTSRNSDMTKGEVWGMKDRGEVVVERCRCLNCGRIWNDD